MTGGQAMKNVDFYICPYDSEPPPFGPCACLIEGGVSFGERTDWLRVRLLPVFPDHPAPDDAGGGFLIAPRFAGDSIGHFGKDSMHVYLVNLREPPSSGSISSDDMATFHWAIIHPTLRAILDAQGK